MKEEDKKRISENAYAGIDREDYSECCHAQGFKAGAEYEHPIAYNQAIEDVLTRLMQNWSKKNASEIYDEVEKLKKP
jgi:serine/threonine protein kinase HipA of HipAB toxin-antitoxin module